MKAFIVWAIRSKLAQIRAYAQANADIDDVVDLLANPLVIPEKQFYELAAMLEKDTWIVDLFGNAQCVAPFEGWFEQLRAAIIAEAEALKAEAEGKQ